MELVVCLEFTSSSREAFSTVSSRVKESRFASLRRVSRISVVRSCRSLNFTSRSLDLLSSSGRARMYIVFNEKTSSLKVSEVILRRSWNASIARNWLADPPYRFLKASLIVLKLVEFFISHTKICASPSSNSFTLRAIFSSSHSQSFAKSSKTRSQMFTSELPENLGGWNAEKKFRSSCRSHCCYQCKKSKASGVCGPRARAEPAFY